MNCKFNAFNSLPEALLYPCQTFHACISHYGSNKSKKKNNNNYIGQIGFYLCRFLLSPIPKSTWVQCKCECVCVHTHQHTMWLPQQLILSQQRLIRNFQISVFTVWFTFCSQLSGSPKKVTSVRFIATKNGGKTLSIPRLDEV